MDFNPKAECLRRACAAGARRAFRGAVTLAGTGRQRRIRSDAIAAFYTRGKGGWVDGRGALPIILGPQ